MTRADVVRAAAGLANSRGAEALTMRGVAREMGVSPMALYNHVENRDDLINALAESFLLYAAETATPGDLSQSVLTLLDHYIRWPYLISVLREANSPEVEAAYRTIVGVIGGEDASPELSRTFLMYDVVARGFVERSVTRGDLDPTASLRGLLAHST